MWAQIIGAVATGLAGLIVAIGGVLASRRSATSEDLSTCRSELAVTQRQLLLCLRHTYRLERMLSTRGITVPQRPDELRNIAS